MRQDETGFAEFYRASYQRCLWAAIAGAGRPDLAEDLVAGTSSWRRHRREVPLGDRDRRWGPRSAHYRPGGHPMNSDSTTTAVLTAVRHAVEETAPAGSADAGCLRS